MRGSVWGTG